MFKLIFQLLVVVAMPLLIIYSLFKGVKGKQENGIYSPFDDSTRGTTHRHDETNPPTDTRQLIENEQVEQYEETESTKVFDEIELEESK